MAGGKLDGGWFKHRRRNDSCSRSAGSGIIVPPLATLGVMGSADIHSETMSADDERVALEFDRRRKGAAPV